MTTDFNAALTTAARLTQERLAAEMAALRDLPVTQGMAYAVQGGKGLRGFLVLESAALHGVQVSAAVAPAAAVEEPSRAVVMATAVQLAAVVGKAGIATARIGGRSGAGVTIMVIVGDGALLLEAEAQRCGAARIDDDALMRRQGAEDADALLQGDGGAVERARLDARRRGRLGEGGGGHQHRCG